MNYVPPEKLAEWRIDIPGQELTLVCILGDRTVLSASGRYAQGSGGKTTSWDRFLQGDMQDLVRETMGEEILHQVLTRLREIVDGE